MQAKQGIVSSTTTTTTTITGEQQIIKSPQK